MYSYCGPISFFVNWSKKKTACFFNLVTPITASIHRRHRMDHLLGFQSSSMNQMSQIGSLAVQNGTRNHLFNKHSGGGSERTNDRPNVSTYCPHTLLDTPIAILFLSVFLTMKAGNVRVDVINKFQTRVTTLLWNNALWLVVTIHVTCIIRSDRFISKCSSYATLKFVYDMGFWISWVMPMMPMVVMGFVKSV